MLAETDCLNNHKSNGASQLLTIWHPILLAPLSLSWSKIVRIMENST